MATRQPKRLRAGVIPYATDDEGETVFLLGKEIYGKWSALAGTVEQGENIKEAAAREFAEEAMGFYKEEDILLFLNDDHKLIIPDKSAISHYYLVPFEWDPNLPGYFRNVTKFLLRCTGNKKNKWGVPVIGTCSEGLFEKSDLAWFRLSDLITMTGDIVRTIFGINATKLIRSLIALDWDMTGDETTV